MKTIAEREKAIVENFNKLHQKIGVLNENGRYDLVSQYKGNHHGNPMPKNEFLNSLGLNEMGIETLQTLVNLITSDSEWCSRIYPSGYDINNIIVDITNFFDDNQSAMDLISKKNPVEYTNKLKDAIERKKFG